MSLRVYYEVLNQKGSPALFTDTLANRPAFGFQGRLFISTDSGQIFEDTGTAWTLIADAGVGGGTLSSVCLNGNTTATGIVITAVGLTSTTGTFSGIVTTPQVKASTSAGLSINANSGTQVANFGAGGGANITFLGGLTGTSANFSLDITVNSATIGRGGGAIATNLVFGSGALAVNTTGFQNIAIGTNSLSLNSTGLSNIAIGHRSLENSIGGGGNIAVGVFSLNNVNTGQSNVGIGLNAGLGLTTGSNNIFIGNGSATGITTGSNNTIIGNYAGTTALANNIVLADGAGNIRYQWDGTNNVFGNPLSGTTITTSGSATFGSDVFTYANGGIFFNGGGSYGSGIFQQSGGNLILQTGTTQRLTIASTGAATFSNSVTAASGLYNGYTSGLPPTSGSATRGGLRLNNASNIAFDFGTVAAGQAWIQVSDASNYASNFSLLLNPNGGNVLIGTTTDSGNGKLVVDGLQGILINSAGRGQRQLYFGSGGDLLFYNTTNNASLSSAGVWTDASDISIKKDIKDIEYGLNEVMKLKPKCYKMIANNLKQIGFIAQDIEEILPELVSTSDKGMKNLSYGQITAVLTKAIQELNEKLVRNNIN